MSRECPRCGLLNPDSADRCDCGQRLAAAHAPVKRSSGSALGIGLLVVGGITLGLFAVLKIAGSNDLRSTAGPARPATATSATNPSPAVTPPPAPLPTPPPVKWRGGVSNSSKMDDSTTVIYSLDAESAIQVWLKTVTPTLIVRCQEHRTEAYVRTESAANVEYGDTRAVRIRWDEKAPAAQYWSPSTDNEALFAPNPVGFIRSLAKSNRLRIQFTPFNADPVVMEFDVSGFGDRIDLLAKTCGWKA